MFKFYFELSGVQKDALAWWCWGGDISGDASCDVALAKYENLQRVESNVEKGKFDQKGYI